MRLRTQLSVLAKYSIVAIIDKHGLELVCKINEVPKNIRERMVKSLYRSSSDLPYDFFIVLKV